MEFVISENPYKAINLLTASHADLMKTAKDLFNARDLVGTKRMLFKVETILYRGPVKQSEEREREYADVAVELDDYLDKIREIKEFYELSVMEKVCWAVVQVNNFFGVDASPRRRDPNVIEYHHYL